MFEQYPDILTVEEACEALRILRLTGSFRISTVTPPMV